MEGGGEARQTHIAFINPLSRVHVRPRPRPGGSPHRSRSPPAMTDNIGFIGIVDAMGMGASLGGKREGDDAARNRRRKPLTSSSTKKKKKHQPWPPPSKPSWPGTPTSQPTRARRPSLTGPCACTAGRGRRRTRCWRAGRRGPSRWKVRRVVVVFFFRSVAISLSPSLTQNTHSPHRHRHHRHCVHVRPGLHLPAGRRPPGGRGSPLCRGRQKSRHSRDTTSPPRPCLPGPGLARRPGGREGHVRQGWCRLSGRPRQRPPVVRGAGWAAPARRRAAGAARRSRGRLRRRLPGRSPARRRPGGRGCPSGRRPDRPPGRPGSRGGGDEPG